MFDFALARKFMWRGEKLDNNKMVDRLTTAGLVASAVPIVFCAFIAGPSAASFFLVENFVELSSIFEHSIPARLFAVSAGYPLLFLAQARALKLCTQNRKNKWALLTAWSGLVVYVSGLSYIGVF